MPSVRAFQGADEIVLTDIYAAGEAPIPGITVERLRRIDPRRIVVAGRADQGSGDGSGGGGATGAAR